MESHVSTDKQQATRQAAHARQRSKGNVSTAMDAHETNATAEVSTQTGTARKAHDSKGAAKQSTGDKAKHARTKARHPNIQTTRPFFSISISHPSPLLTQYVSHW